MIKTTKPLSNNQSFFLEEQDSNTIIAYLLALAIDSVTKKKALGKQPCWSNERAGLRPKQQVANSDRMALESKLLSTTWIQASPQAPLVEMEQYRACQRGEARRNIRVDRRLSAVLAVDIVDYSLLMGADEETTVRDLKDHQQMTLPLISSFNGRIVDSSGDGFLAEFASALDATRCALAVQEVSAKLAKAADPKRRMEVRVGVNLGDLIFDGSSIYGDVVNVAARLESIALPGGICISKKVYDEVRGKLNLMSLDCGEHQLKNIRHRVHVFSIAKLGTLGQLGVNQAASSKTGDMI